MAKFTAKERREHATAVGYHGAPVKADSQFSEEQQRAYNRGVADTLNRQTIGYLLGKNSPLSEAEKAQMRADRAQKTADYRAKVAKSAKKGGRK